MVISDNFLSTFIHFKFKLVIVIKCYWEKFPSAFQIMEVYDYLFEKKIDKVHFTANELKNGLTLVH